MKDYMTLDKLCKLSHLTSLITFKSSRISQILSSIQCCKRCAQSLCKTECELSHRWQSRCRDHQIFICINIPGELAIHGYS